MSIFTIPNLQLRKEVRDGIEFFVSNDGDEAGMSILGIATFTGVSVGSVGGVIEAYSNFGKLPSETLEDIRSKGFHIRQTQVGSGKPVSFIPAELCEALIWYYAFEAKRVSKEVQAKAKYAYRQFAAIGIKTWILEVTGFKSSQGHDLTPYLTLP